MIQLVKVSKRFGETWAVKDVSLDIQTGQTLCFIGTSGCGKTTTMKMINRLLDATSGQVLIDGQDVQAMDVIRLRRGQGYVTQRGGLFPHMTVAENVGLLPRMENWKKEDIRQKVDHLLELVNLDPAVYRNRYPVELSGGQQQRVGVARALVLDPPIILMDEPFGALDPVTRRQIQDEFVRLKERFSKTVIMVTHDLPEAFRLGDVIALMHGGSLVQVGTSEDFLQRPANEFVRSFVDVQVA
ncbi:MAG TPA: ATP-binding cassette domain-containing protein [Candidatus Xenobia bacterium]|jgi:osmoprotectant transport system ATP-binding protein